MLVKITTWLAIFTNKPFLNFLIKFPSICKKTIIFLGTALVMLLGRDSHPINKEPDHERIQPPD